jgi:hypothetical protein
MDFPTYFITVSADGRTHVKPKILWKATEFPAQALDPVFQDPSYHPPPSGMEETDGTPERVHQRHRHAIRHRHSEQNSPGSGDVPVCFGAEAQSRVTLSWGDPLLDQHLPAVDLMGVANLGKPEAAGQPLPRFPRPRGRRIGEQGKVPTCSVLVRRPARGALDEPGKPGFPIGMYPVGGIAWAQDFLDSMDVNPGVCWAYHGNGLPDIGRMGPWKLL